MLGSAGVLAGLVSCTTAEDRLQGRTTRSAGVLAGSAQWERRRTPPEGEGTVMEDFRSYRRKSLPHWRASGSVYFVTWRLAPGAPALAPEERSTVASALKHFEGDRYIQHAWVGMDDHVHTLTEPFAGNALESIVQAWKSFTSHCLVRRGRVAPVWQREYHDRIIRNESDLVEKALYIIGNPSRRWPDLDGYTWRFARGM
jgi:REP element-mobilizing transposase RayT